MPEQEKKIELHVLLLKQTSNASQKTGLRRENWLTFFQKGKKSAMLTTDGAF